MKPKYSLFLFYKEINIKERLIKVEGLFLAPLESVIATYNKDCKLDLSFYGVSKPYIDRIYKSNYKQIYISYKLLAELEYKLTTSCCGFEFNDIQIIK